VLPVRPGPPALVEHTFHEVNAPLLFYLLGGDDRSPRILINVIPAPELIEIVGTYRYPPYTGLPDRIIPGGDVRALEGTRVDLAFTCSTELNEITFQLDDDTPARYTFEAPNVWRLESGLRSQASGIRTPDTGHLTPDTLPKPRPPHPGRLVGTPKTFQRPLVLRQRGTYQVHLLDRNGLTELRPERYEIDVIADEPPIAEITEPRRDLVATPRASLHVGLRATDDFGLAEVKFLHAVGDAKPSTLTDHITGPIPQKGLSSAQAFTWDLSKMGFKPPLRLTY